MHKTDPALSRYKWRNDAHNVPSRGIFRFAGEAGKRVETNIMAIRQALAGCALLLTLSACDAGSDPRVRDIEGVAGQTFADPSTLSFTIDGGAKDVTLNGVFSTMAIETRMIDADGKPLRPGVGIVIPAGLDYVLIEARTLTEGWGGEAFRLVLP